MPPGADTSAAVAGPRSPMLSETRPMKRAQALAAFALSKLTRRYSFPPFSPLLSGQPGRARPVFVVGAPRSGTSVLTWSLGQHSNLLSLEETDWLARLVVDLGAAYELGTARGDRSHLSSMGITTEALFESVGRSVDGLILDHRVR